MRVYIQIGITWSLPLVCLFLCILLLLDKELAVECLRWHTLSSYVTNLGVDLPHRWNCMAKLPGNCSWPLDHVWNRELGSVSVIVLHELCPKAGKVPDICSVWETTRKINGGCAIWSKQKFRVILLIFAS